MIAEEQEYATRLREELADVAVRASAGQVDTVLRQVHRRRRDRRNQRIQVFTAMAVVALAVAGAFAVTTAGEHAEPARQVDATTPMAQWPARGELAADKDLVARAEQAWHSYRQPPRGPLKPLFAGVSPNMSANMVVVALIAPESGQVAFVTTPIRVNRPSDPRDRLLVRAVAPVTPEQRGVGFMASRPLPEDEPPIDQNAVGMALTSPAAENGKVYTSTIDSQSEPSWPTTVVGALWPQYEMGAGAWNSELRVQFRGAASTEDYTLVTGVSDDVDLGPVALRRAGAALRAEGPGVRQGDLIITPNGVVGVVAAPDGTVDTRLSELAAHGTVGVAISRVPGRVREVGDHAEFTATGPGDFGEEQRLVLQAWDEPRLALTFAKLAGYEPHWLVARTAGPDAAENVLRLGKPGAAKP
ncbi:hypothetical protein V5P93_006868 [Actinokineospora auranticolor]|uniref:Uncharacterized protein n=1 Tax=Actinokineospora auranticolor TaxID=155976 RepID=A0A2S6GWC0_9PSEU|nr:hypothetical protein [Actinokineospora auranticolor]PPK69488.1 hypothetical protein CLV40_10395 [Actinokineospora auranticolor]